jgi:peroxiredoxin
MPPDEPRTSIYTWEVALDPGMPFPSIALRDEKGRAAAVPPGEVLYAFFKTTCPTSELAWPYLDRVRKIGEGGGLSVLAVSQDDPEMTARFYEDLGVAIPTLYDREPWEASEAVGLTNVPAFLVVGGDGIIRDVAVGFQRHKMEEFAELAADRAGRRGAALFLPGENVPALKPG